MILQRVLNNLGKSFNDDEQDLSNKKDAELELL